MEECEECGFDECECIEDDGIIPGYDDLGLGYQDVDEGMEV